MNKKGPVYKIRRKFQTIATRLFGYKVMTQVYYRIILKKRCNLSEPQTLNEKICWLKVYHYPYNDLIIQCADKYRVREYVEKKIGAEYLVPLLGHWSSADEIDFNTLSDKFVLKCNHGSRYNLLVEDKSSLNTEEVRKQLNTWLKEDFSLFNAEPHYHTISRKIICEKFIENELTDYKFFCANGKILFYYIASGLLKQQDKTLTHYLPDDTLAPFQKPLYKNKIFEISPLLCTLKKLAETMAEDFHFVRVDFVVAGDQIYFSELTFSPSGGYNLHNPQEKFDQMGEMLDISDLLKQGGQ